MKHPSGESVAATAVVQVGEGITSQLTAQEGRGTSTRPPLAPALLPHTGTTPSLNAVRCQRARRPG